MKPLLLAAAMLAVVPTVATAFLSKEGLLVEGGPERFSVQWRPAYPQEAYWCSAAAYVIGPLGLPRTTEIYRLAPPQRFADVEFSVNAIPEDKSHDQLFRSATGLFSFPRGNSLTAAHALGLCEILTVPGEKDGGD